MRCTLLLCLLALVLWLASGATAKDFCEQHLKQLATVQGQFVHCTTVHSVPVELCIGCEPLYSEMVVAYMVLRKEKNCTDKFFDKDRINIVSTTQSILTGLWARAYCDDCFNSNNSYVFDLKSNEFKDCLIQNKNAECIACLPYYVKLNTFYKELEKNNNGKVCYDMQDSMNRTRSQWSKQLNCCHREMDMMLFIIIGLIMALLPFIFYGSLFIAGKRRERNHGLLNEAPELGNSPSSSVATLPASTSTITTVPQTNTPFSSTVVKQKPKNVINFDSDSSDEFETEKPFAPAVHEKIT